MVTILCIALIIYLVYKMTDLCDPVMCFLVTGIFVTFPAITSVFGYMFTAPYYYFGLLCGVFGICLFNRKKNLLTLLLCIVLMACAVGTYQVNISALTCVLILITLQHTLHSEYHPHDILKAAAGILLPAAGSMAAYLIVNQIFLKVKGIEMVSDRRNISGMGMTGISGYLGRILIAYKEFFYPSTQADENTLPSPGADRDLSDPCRLPGGKSFQGKRPQGSYAGHSDRGLSPGGVPGICDGGTKHHPQRDDFRRSLYLPAGGMAL